MELIKMWASCEECGLAWAKTYEFKKNSDWGKIECPKCSYKTENFDDKNYNEDMKFLDMDKLPIDYNYHDIINNI